MTLLSIWEMSNGSWNVYLGDHTDPKTKQSGHPTEEEAIDAAQKRGKDVILVIRQGEIGGYSRKFEKAGLGYNEVQ